MNKSLRKITTVAVFASVVITIITFYWFFYGGKPVEITDNNKPEKTEEIDNRAEELYQTALSKYNPEKNLPEDMVVAALCCQQILTEYPESPQAEKAKEIVSEIPAKYQGLTLEQAREQALEDNKPPGVKKSRPLRRSMPRRSFD